MQSPDKSIEKLLVDGSPPAAPDTLFAAFDRLRIKHSTISHAPMRTVADSIALRGDVPGGYSKNLFLRNRKGKMVLVTVLEHRTVDLKLFGDLIGIGKPGFASQQRLMRYLGVIPGAVTPLAVINDVEKVVTAVLDQALLQMDPLHVHPCDNRMTTTVTSDSLLNFMRSVHREPTIIDFDQSGLTLEP